jgi:hypothetical protein
VCSAKKKNKGAQTVLLFSAPSGGRGQKVNVSKLNFQYKLQVSNLEINILCAERNVCQRKEERQFECMRCNAPHNKYVIQKLNELT